MLTELKPGRPSRGAGFRGPASKENESPSAGKLAAAEDLTATPIAREESAVRLATKGTAARNATVKVTWEVAKGHARQDSRSRCVPGLSATNTVCLLCHFNVLGITLEV